jgi:hypothetical protein
MADSISCPNCKSLLELPEEHVGREVRCPGCQSTFVPGATTGIMKHLPPLTSGVQVGQPEENHARHQGADFDDDELDVSKPVASLGEYKPGAGLARVVKILLGLHVLAGLITLVSDYMQFELAERLIAGAMVPPPEIDGNDARQNALAVVDTLVYLGCVIGFVIWFHRAHANLKPLGARRLTFTSGWAAGCWFVPILNLYRPVQIAQEIWRNSDMIFDGDDVGKPPPNSGLIGCWWAMWIIAGVTGQISLRVSMAVNSPQSLKSATEIAMAAEVASIMAAVLAFAVVSAIDSRQTMRAKALGIVDK